MQFAISPELQMRLKGLNSPSTMNVPDIQNFSTTAFTLTSPAQQTGVSLDRTLLFSNPDPNRSPTQFAVFASHMDGTQTTQLTVAG